MAELNTQIARVAGQPSSVRIGRVASVSPLVITAQGVEFTNVGILGSYLPNVDDVVSLLGQSSAVGADPASWLCLGSVGSAPAVHSQAGQARLSFVTLTSSFVDVTFPRAFAAIPSITVTIATSVGSTANWFCRTSFQSTTGFRINVNGPSATWVDVPLHWIAHEMTT